MLVSLVLAVVPCRLRGSGAVSTIFVCRWCCALLCAQLQCVLSKPMHSCHNLPVQHQGFQQHVVAHISIVMLYYRLLQQRLYSSFERVLRDERTVHLIGGVCPSNFAASTV